MDTRKNIDTPDQLDAFLTGGTGFVGRWLLRSLTASGKRVGVLMRGSETRVAELRAWLDEHQGDGALLSPFSGDLAAPGLGLSTEDADRLAQTPFFFHFGAAFGWGLDPDLAYRANVAGSRELVALAGRSARLERILYPSGFMVAHAERWRALDIPDDPDGPAEHWRRLYHKLGAYEASKYQAHLAITQAVAAADLPLTLVHPAAAAGYSLTGEIDPAQGFAQLVQQVVDRKLAAVPGGADDWLPIVAIDYLAEFCARVVELPEAVGQEYVLLDQRSPRLLEMVTALAEHAGVRAPRRRIPLGLLRFVLRAGLGRVMGTSHESLSFIDSLSYDTASADKAAAQMGLEMPPTRDVMARTAEYVAGMRA